MQATLPGEIEKNHKDIKFIDETSRALMESIYRKERIKNFWALVAFGLLLSVGVISIVVQNKLANENSAHINCIVKLFESPNRAHLAIVDGQNQCNLKQI